MEENIETKDAQRTEYLDKNGLDMLWAKVKENTHNQVEAERDRATTQENRIIETKADKSELHSSYVSNSTFTALQEKVAANTDAISDKQDAGNYLHYETLNNEGYYEIPSISIASNGGNNKTDIDSQSISVKCDVPDGYTTITCDGISNTDNNASHVYATDGSIADLTQYIKKGDTDVKFVPYVKKGPNQYNQDESYWLSNGLQFGDLQTNHTVIVPTAFDARYDNHRTNLNVDSTADYAVDILNYGTSRSVKVVWDTMKLAFTTESNSLSDATTYSLAGVRLFASLSSKKPENTLVLGTDEDYKEIGVDIAPLENGKVPAEYLDLSQYAKKTDIPAVDTSDFVSKTATNDQSIKSKLSVFNALDIVDGISDYPKASLKEINNDMYLRLMMPNDDEKYAHLSTSELQIGPNIDQGILITRWGIRTPDDDMQHVFTTAGTIANLNEYVRKESIGDGLNINDDGVVSVDTTAISGGNVDDVQVNGVTVVENKIANIKPATKEGLGVVKVGDGLNVTDGVISVNAGNYLTYDSVTNESYYISSPKTFIFNGNDQDPALSIGNNHIIVGNNNTRMYSKMLDSYIELRADKNALDISCANITGNEYKGDDPTPYQQFVLNKKGVWLYGGDNNHVLTSNASTIDITQYALKSELPTVPTKISQLQNDSNFAYKEEVVTFVNNLEIDVNRLSTDKQDKIIPGNLNISALNSQNTIVALKNTIMDLISVLEKSGVITVTSS